jgi:Tfp pilus assembly PilM family ATPase
MLHAGMAAGDNADQPRGAPAAVAQERGRGQAPATLRFEIPNAAQGSDTHIDFSDLVDAIADELSMCLRYHRSLFGGRSIDRTIFLGGEARQIGVCQHIAQALRVPAQLGDPIARIENQSGKEPRAEWAVACGLCVAPTDL